MPLHIRGKHLIFKTRNRILECLTLTLKSAVSVDFGDQRSITNLTECLVHVVVPHIVGLQKLKNIGGNNGGRHINVVYGGSVNLTVICGTL
jgi:hypothetical protein